MLKFLSMMMLWFFFAAVGHCDERVEMAPSKRGNGISIPAPIQTLMSGFNRGSAENMGTAVSETCEVRYVDDQGKSSLGSRSRQELVKQMDGYFSHIKEPRSQLSQVTIFGRFVSARESVSWRKGDKRLTQFSLVVFELEEKADRIARVWYYPAQREEDVHEPHKDSPKHPSEE
ncbi:MAG: hypothetical protein AAGI63_04620 [Planctomycetota bacterium]